MNDKPRLIVVDDHPLYRDGVVRTLQDSGLFDVIGAGADCQSALKLARAHMPEVALLDISMPGGGLAALSEMREKFPDIKVIMLTASENDADVLAAMNSGAQGYVLKGVGGRELAGIVADVAAGGSYVAPSLAARVLLSVQDKETRTAGSAIKSLTKREEQVLRLVTAGRSNKEIAIELDLQEKTIKHHMTSVLSKLKVRNRVEAAVLARDFWS